MKNTALTLLLALFFFTINSNAQNEYAKNGIAFRWTWNNFQLPLGNGLHREDYSTGVELTYVRHLSNYLNLAVPLKFGKAKLPIDDQGNTLRDEQLIGSLDALLHLKLFKPDNILYPYLLGGAGIMDEFENGNKINVEFPVGIGLNLRLAPSIYVSAETQYRFDLSSNRNQLQHAAGLWFIIGKATPPEEKVSDADKDGIPDAEDQCPNEPGIAKLFGCPDSDGDGVADKLDDCPTVAGLANLRGCPDKDGDMVPDHKDKCPDVAGLLELEGCPQTDRDGDGVKDEIDRCPDQPGPEYTLGCPDGDGDGIPDAEDKCPTIAGLPNMSGCPDTDNDGISDPEDRCPTTPGPASNKGCPELKPEEKEVLEFAMKAVQFETGSAFLLQSSKKVLDEIATIMGRYPEQKLRISGHTDSIGDPGPNQVLSEKRAKACYEYLASRGIQTSRMSYAGYGETKPIADNRFAPGREKNRRVEFEIYAE
ncbi:MAG: OmpA family protein [Lewinellaceae bacterium]|nr:OmpA family protein [Saprospiraceae bacterium]MCB9339947.1 OmpA family protein [Lewinellaceae bacterium]